MKRIFFLFLVLMFINQIAVADTATEIKPIAFIGEKAFKFNPVVEGDRIHHEFTLKNNETAPLEILKIESG